MGRHAESARRAPEGLYISIELFYDQASMLLKYYLFSLSRPDEK